MGCASSQPADVGLQQHDQEVGKLVEPRNGVAQVQQQGQSPVFAGQPDSLVSAGKAADQVTAPAQPQEQAKAATQQAAPQQQPAPAPAAPELIEEQKEPSVHRRSRRQPEREEDEESNWDQCSTGHYMQQQPSTNNNVIALANGDIPSPTGNTLQAKPSSDQQQQPTSASQMAVQIDLPPTEESSNGSPPLEDQQEVDYKETTTMRVEKLKGCMFVNQYLVVKFLGRGACGKVFLCLNTNDLRLYAMKAVRKVDVEATQAHNLPPGAKPRRNPMEDLKREILIMKRMKHNNIVMLSEVIDDPAGSKLLLVMEFMAGGPVLTREALEKRERLPEMLALQYFRDMVKSLDYLHCNKVVHGDLKPENVLMSATGEVKLSDFGCSKIFVTGNEYLERCNGTPAFLAPEMMKPNTRFRGRPTDVYALGACLYTLVYGRIPFSAPNLYKLFQVVQNEPVRFPEDVPVTDALKHLLNSMLSKNPRDRITLPDIMRHPWVTMSGHFPLRSTRDLKADETQERHSGLVNGMTFAECHPCPDYLSGLALLSHHERHFKEGDYIMRQGDPGTFLLYIVSGTVDVLVRWSKQPRHTGNSSSNINSRGPDAKPGTQDEFAEEGEGLSPAMDTETYDHRLNLGRAASKARDFINNLQQASGMPSELLVAQRGPGELVGEMALFSKNQARFASVRCNTPVIARVVTHDQLVQYLGQQPMAKHQIREGIWKKESEITIVEALVKLANAYDLILQSIAHAGALAGPPPLGAGVAANNAQH